MEPVPAAPQRDLVSAQPAGVEQSEQLQGREVAAAEHLELGAAVLVDVPGVSRALRAGRRERQDVRRRDVDRAALAYQPAHVLEHAVGVLEMLDRLQEHDGVGRLGEAVDEVPLEAKVCGAVAQSRVLVGIGVGVDADHRRRAACEHRGAVALAARHVDDTQPLDALGDPLVHDQVAAVPVVLGGHVGERPLSSQRKRGHSVGLVSLQVDGFAHRVGPRAAATAGEYMVGKVPATLSAEEIRDANTRYHDVAATHYDAKWGIDFGATGRRQVRAKFAKALGYEPATFGRSLEIGAGTGYFTLNLLLDGLIEDATCVDISAGMLATLEQNAANLGLDVATRAANAEELPFADESFDLVFGHAVLHHIPDLDRAMREFARVLAPGGTLLFAGEPSRYGDRLARMPKRAAQAAAPLWRIAMRAAAADGSAPCQVEDLELERVVDVHAFSPGRLASAARQAQLADVRVSGEELLANWFGWANRTLEASAAAADVPWLWRQYAYRGYLVLQRVDGALLERRLPPAVFYNLLVSARKRAG